MISFLIIKNSHISHKNVFAVILTKIHLEEIMRQDR